jgi:hypothetical protein
MVNVTDKEKDVLVNGLFGSCFNSFDPNASYGGVELNYITVWSNCVVDSCRLVTEKEISGVISSLVKKDLVVCEGHGRDAVVLVTGAGFEVIKSLIN